MFPRVLTRDLIQYEVSNTAKIKVTKLAKYFSMPSTYYLLKVEVMLTSHSHIMKEIHVKGMMLRTNHWGNNRTVWKL